MIKNNINSFYLLPSIEPSFYNDLINIEKIPIFNDLKNNFNEIKKELVNNFSLFSEEEEKNYLYSDLGMYFKAKNTEEIKNPLLAYSLQMPNISFDNMNKLNEEEKEKIKVMLNIKNMKDKSPFTLNIIKNLQEKQILTTCLVVKLKANSYIKPHKDPKIENILRVHYCLVNDENCSITVGDETRKWKENDFLIFNPYGFHKHSVVHNGTIDRIILLFDLKRSYLEAYYK